MTLALLLTAVGGAWAQNADYDIYVGFDNYYDPTETHFMCMISNMTDPSAEIKGTLDLSVDGVPKGSFDVNSEMVDGNIAALDAGDHTWSAVFKPEGGGSFNRNGNFTINKAYTNINYYGSTSVEMTAGESTELDVYLSNIPMEAGELSYSSSDASVVSITKKEYSYNTYIIQANAAGTATITFSFAGNKNYKAAEEDITITVTVLPAPIKVTLNEAKTEASFEMQTFDMDVDYELVRDMSVQMTAQVGTDPEAQPRYRVQWNGENWVPADMTQQQVAALFSVNDLVENTTLDPKNYFVSIYAVNEQGETTGNPMTFLNFTFAPGRYAVTASAMLGSPTYDGTTALSNTFELFQGYEVEIAAQSFATYYKDEALTIDESTAEDAALYTISEVTATEAVLSDEIEAAPSSTPLLVFNSSDKTRTILLIPTNEPNLALTVAPEFKGTATAKTFSEADMEAANFYVLTDANAFVWVKGAGQIAANKCWLQIEKTAPNNTRAIVFDNDATSINEELRVKNEESAGAVFDLSGRKVANGKWLNGKLPNGVYIINGKKMVVK